jgi:hypothetical protein
VDTLPPHLQPALDALRQAFPSGVAEEDYPALLVALDEDFSEEGMGLVVGALTDTDPVVVINDHAAALSRHQPAPEKVREMAEKLQGLDLG